MNSSTPIINIFQLDLREVTNQNLQQLLDSNETPFKLISAIHDPLAVYKGIKADKFDLIIITYEMPLITGERVIRLIRSKGIIAPIIGVSNNTDFKVKELMLCAGADFFISRDNTPKEIIKMLLKPFKDDDFRRKNLYRSNQ